MINEKRRGLLLGSLAAAASATLPLAGCASLGSSRGIEAPLLIRGAYLMTMDPVSGDVPAGDVLIRDGKIAAVGKSLTAEGATVIEARDMILLPGFVDAHTHLWSTQMRGAFGDTPQSIYFLTRNRLANGYTADDMYVGTLLGAVEALHGGITTTVDFCHNIRSESFAFESVRAIKESGIRARWLYGPSTAMKPTDSVDLAVLERLNRNWNALVGQAPVTLGFNWRGPLGITTIQAQQAPPSLAVAQKEYEVARQLGLPVSLHISGVTAEAQFRAVSAGGYLGPHLQLIHMTGASAAQLSEVREKNSPVALTPVTELRVGYGVTQLSDFIDSGVRLGFGIDSNSLAGSADIFQVLRLFQGLEAGRKKNELATTPRKLLEIVTIGGARSLGMDAEIGSIAVGKKADLQLIDTRAINLGMFAADPAHMIVEACRPENVRTVLVEGRIVKRDGVLTQHDAAEVVHKAKRSIQEIIQRTQS